MSPSSGSGSGSGYRRWSDVRAGLVLRRIEAVRVESHDDYPTVSYAVVPRTAQPPLLVVHDADDHCDTGGVIWLEENDLPPTSDPAAPGHALDLTADEAVALGYALLAVALPPVRRTRLRRAHESWLARADTPTDEEDL